MNTLQRHLTSWLSSLILLFIAYTTSLTAAAATSVGTPRANFGTTALGGAVYTIAIDAPHVGTNLQPTLAIVYNSQSGNGIAGWGCSLTGISAITRAPKDLYHDEGTQGVSYEAADAYCLDGRRLILKSGTEGTAGAVYTLDGAPHTTLTITSGTNGTWFKVHTPDGLDYEYGNSSDARQTFYSSSAGATRVNAWYANKITNAVGDYMTFNYSQITQCLYPTQITYGRTGSNVTGYMLLTYESRNDTQTFWVGDAKGTMSQRLKTITTGSGSEVYRSYQLTYNTTGDLSGTKFSRLTTVTEYNAAGDALAPVTLTWDYLPDERQKVESPSITLPESDSGVSFSDRYFLTGDINGDGISDLVQISPVSIYGFNHTYAYVFLSEKTANGSNIVGTRAYSFPAEYSFDKAYFARNHTPAIADLDGDGRGELLIPLFESNVSNIFHLNYISGSALASNSPNYSTECLNIFTDNTSSIPLYTVADFNHDGKQDVVVLETGQSNNGYSLHYVYDVPGVGKHKSTLTLDNTPRHLFTGDFNNDGLLDIIVLHDDGYKVFYNSGGSTTSNLFSDTNNTTGTNITSADHVSQGDFDGDGMADFLLNDENDANYYFALGTGNGTFQKTQACQLDIAGQSTSKDDDRFTFLAYDLNSDGRSDLVLVKSSYQYHGGLSNTNKYKCTDVRWLLSTGTSLEPYRTLSYTGGEDEARAYNLLLGDFTGNGEVELLNYGSDLYTSGTATSSATMAAAQAQPVDNTVAAADLNDIAHFAIEDVAIAVDSLATVADADALTSAASATPVFHLYRNLHKTVSSGKVVSACDGLTNNVNITYSPLTASSVYTKGSDSSYPIADVGASLHVVSAVTASNGAAPPQTEHYSYGGLKLHLQGRGLLGFATSTVENTTTNTTTMSNVEWNTTYYTPSQTTATITTGDLTATTKTTLTMQSRDTEHGGRKNYYAYPSTRQETDWYGHTATTTYNYNTSKGVPTQELTYYGSSSMYKKIAYGTYTLKGGRYVPGSVTLTQKHPDDSQAFSTTTTYGYNANGQTTSKCENSGTTLALTTSYTHNGIGMLASETVSGNGVPQLTTYYIYNARRQISRRYTSPASTDISYTYDTWGNVLTETDNTNTSSPQTTTNTYDGWGRLATTTAPTGIVTTVTRGWGSGNSKFYVRQEATGQPWTVTYYDGMGRETSTASIGEGGMSLSTTTSYNSRGQVSSKTSKQGTLTLTTSYGYDAQGRLTSETSGGLTTTYSYGDRSMSVSAPTYTLSKSYDAWGNVVSSSDAQGSVSYTYASCGKPKTISTGGSTVTLTYDNQGNQLTLSDPDAGQTSYAYDAAGRVKQQTDARGKTTTTSYDALGRVTSVAYADETVSYTYGTSGNGAGRLTGMQNANGTLAYSYDQYGRLASETRTLTGESTLTTTYSYDTSGHLSTTVYPQSLSIGYSYNTYGFRTSMSKSGSPLSFFWSNTGKRREVVLRSGLHHVTELDANGWLSALSMRYGATRVDSIHHQYNASTGNLSVRYRTGQAGNSYDSYSYDALDRLTNVTGSNWATATYASNGNILSKRDGGGAPVKYYSYDAAHPHAVAGVENNLGLISSDAQEAEYDGSGRILHLEEGDYEMDFVYGPDGQRWKTVLRQNGTAIRTTVYASDYERVTENGTTRHFYYLDDGCVYVKTDGQSDAYYYAFTDHLGSVMQLVTDVGASVFEAKYDAWGRQTVVKNEIGFHRGYTSHEMLPEFGLINMNGRLYDPVLARFLSPDNYVQLPDFSQSYNRYSYCLNNPLRYTDPSGELFGIDDAVIAFAVFNMAHSMMQAAYNGQNVWKAGGLSLLSSAASYGVGAAFGGVGNVGHELLRAGAHGLTSGVVSALDGGNFFSSCVSGAAASGIGSFAQGVNISPGLMMASTTAMGGAVAWATGGNFLIGAMNGLNIGMLNHGEHDVITYTHDASRNIVGTLPEVVVTGKKSGILFAACLNVGSLIFSSYAANRYYASPFGNEYWRTSSGRFYDSSILKRQTNGKYVRGVQGIRNSRALAKKSVKLPTVAGKALGLTVAINDGVNTLDNPTLENFVDLGRSVLSYYSLPYAAIDFYLSTSIEYVQQTINFNIRYGLPQNFGLYNPTLGY